MPYNSECDFNGPDPSEDEDFEDFEDDIPDDDFDDDEPVREGPGGGGFASWGDFWRWKEG